MGKRSLAMEYVMYAVINTLDCPNFDSILAFVKSMYADYCNITNIMEELKSATKSKAELSDKLEKFETAWKGLLWTNNKL